MKKIVSIVMFACIALMGFASAACPECIDPRYTPGVVHTPSMAALYSPALPPTGTVTAQQPGTPVYASLTTPSAPAAAPASKGIFDWLSLLGPVLPTLLSLLAAAGTAALAATFTYIRNKTRLIKVQAVQTVLDALWPLLFSKVQAIFTESTTLLKAAAADGKLTPDEAKAALRTAVEDAWKGLPQSFVTTLLGAYGSEGAAKIAIADKVGEVLSTVKGQTVPAVSTLGVSADPTAVPAVSIPTTAQLAAARAYIGLR